MTTKYVLEIDPWQGDTEAGAIIDAAAIDGCAGVVIKGSQGQRWAREGMLDLIDSAHAVGVNVGWLHYIEPGTDTFQDEAVFLLRLVGATHLGLGFWVEVEDRQGVELFALTDWIKGLEENIATPRRPAAVITDPTSALTMSGLGSAQRWVMTEPDHGGVLTPWATLSDTSYGVDKVGPVTCYELASIRSLVPVVVPRSRVGRALPSLDHLPPDDPEPVEEPEVPSPAESDERESTGGGEPVTPAE